MSLVQRFKKNIQSLEQTAQGEIELDYKNPKLYKKVLRFYEDQGIEFYDDPYDTYELIVDLLKEDLQKVESEYWWMLYWQEVMFDLLNMALLKMEFLIVECKL